MTWESKAMKSWVGLHCWGLGVGSGLHLAAGTNEKKGKSFMEGKEVGSKKKGCSNHLITVLNHSNHANLSDFFF
jgi:hypothetical protein